MLVGEHCNGGRVLFAIAYLERLTMSVNEELAASRVPIAASLGRVSEQRAREPVQSSSLRLEPLSADVDDHSLTSAGGTQMFLLADVHRRRRHARLVVGGRRETDRRVGRRAERGPRCRVVAHRRTNNGR